MQNDTHTNSPNKAAKAYSLVLVILGLLALFAIWHTGEGAPNQWAPAFLIGYTVAWIAYLLAGLLVNRTAKSPRWTIIWIIVCALALRLVALDRTPPLSTDAWRYLWDGRIANDGINPYRYAPDAPELLSLRDQNWRHINYKHISTIYPPAAQVLFTLLARMHSRDLTAFRWAFTLFDLGNMLLLLLLLRRTSIPLNRLLWYAWSPLVITEVTAGVHVDPYALFFLLAAFLLTDREGKPGILSGIALAVSAMAKGYGILALPFFLKQSRWRVALPFLATSVLLLAPYISVGPHLFSGFRSYLGGWEINSSLFLIIRGALEYIGVKRFLLVRAVSIALIVLTIALLYRSQANGLPWLLSAGFAAIGAQLLFGAPTFPWYVLWIVPVLCWWKVPGLLLFTFTVSVQYYGRWLYPGDRSAHYALLWAGYVPVYCLLIGQGFQLWLKSRHPKTTCPQN